MEWNNSLVLEGDIVTAIKELKAQPGKDLQIIGSGNMIQTLQAASLIDVYNIWVFPVVLGRGKKLFDNHATSCALQLVTSKISATGVVMSNYIPVGEIQIGFIGEDKPSAKELLRRAKIKETDTW